MDQFELTPTLESSTLHKSVISGRMKRYDNGFIYVEICAKHFPKMMQFREKDTFDIYFKVNTLPFEIQHKAVEYAETFALHSSIIANPAYNCDQKGSTTNQTKYEFR